MERPIRQRPARPEPSSGFAIALYAGRVKAEQQLGEKARRLMDWCAGIATREGTVCVCLSYAPLLEYLGCSYSTARRALDEAAAKGWLVEARFDGRNTIAKLGAMYGHQGGKIGRGIAAKVYERALGICLSNANAAEVDKTVGEQPEALKRLRRVCGLARARGMNFHDVGAVLKLWRTANIFEHKPAEAEATPAPNEPERMRVLR